MVRSAAIPTDTITTMVNFGITPPVTKSTCPARICKSGSAMEIKKPRMSPAIPTIHILLVFVRAAPIRLPMGVIPLSTPTKKIDNPIIMSKAPRRNLINWGVSRLVRVKCNTKTITVMGRTENITSLNFSKSIFKCNFLSSYIF
ncbi:MAG: hypothetical protein A4E56_02616 [Pelotomaculum sp. PtaU1.Bin065]|nr:MAG: hypothetical protein A4E56_02616 [Pelotomaculum sp. PtaU1.Bin065]